MNIRCSFCQTPYTLSRVALLDALQEVDAQNLTHYDAHCPRCRRATPIPRQKLEMAMPNWRDELKQFESEMKENPQHEAPLPKPEEEAAAPTPPAPEPVPAKKSAKAQATPTQAKKTATKKGTSKKSS
ncbi:MAG: hypothetical protein ACM3PS_14985 [Syntrophothermus sp.]